MNNITGLTPKQLRRAADLQERILNLQAELQAILGVLVKPSAAPETPKAGGKKSAGKRGKKKFSAATKKALSEAMKARWAAKKAAGKKSL